MLSNHPFVHARPHSSWTLDIDLARELFLLQLQGRYDTAACGRLKGALGLVEQSHQGQTRKGSEAPYAIHPIRVATSLITEFDLVDPDLVCAALLHDLIEDTAATSVLLGDRFGARCADLVSTVTRREGEQRGHSGDSFTDQYIQRVIHAGDDALVLKLADKLDNLRDARYHPDASRVALFISETFPTYIRLAREVTDLKVSARAERLLLIAAAEAGGEESPAFLSALLDCIRHRLAVDPEVGSTLDEVPFPDLALRLYLYLNPDARCWLEFDGVSLIAERIPPVQLARKIAHGLREIISGQELVPFLRLAGLPDAFGSSDKHKHWKRAAQHLTLIQQLLKTPDKVAWLDTLCSDSTCPALLALIQSRAFLPASWQCPLWSVDLGAEYSRRAALLSGSETSALIPFAIDGRLALIRHVQGLGTRSRAASVFVDIGRPSKELWSLRIGAEDLEMSTCDAVEDPPALAGNFAPDLGALWDSVNDTPFVPASLPPRGMELQELTGLTLGAEQSELIELSGLKETQAVFAEVGSEGAFRMLLKALVEDVLAGGRRTWIEFDPLEWKKRRTFWSAPNGLRLDLFGVPGRLEESGVRILARTVGENGILKVLPARRFALRDRLPEITPEVLDRLAQGGYTATALFDELLLRAGSGELWVPRVYRILDTIEDLDPESVQSVTVEFEGPERIPPLVAHLPLPSLSGDPRQGDRKAFVAKYIVAQIYNSAIIRQVRSVRFRCSSVPDGRGLDAFSEQELEEAIGRLQAEHGYQAFANYVERYGYDPFVVAPAAPEYFGLPFGKPQIEVGTYVAVDIGGTDVKIGLFRNGFPIGLPESPRFPTPRNMDVSQFCRSIMDQITSWLQGNSIKWSEVQGLGISWPGAVRSNRLAGASGVLRSLQANGLPFRDDDPINRLPGLHFADQFKAQLEAVVANSGDCLDENFTISIQNDGDAEALGNHALRVRDLTSRGGGKLFVKLGTSIAGGRITPDGDIAEEVAEYAKVVLNLNTVPNPQWPSGTARYYASAVGVRQLSRNFVYDGELLFGSRGGINEEDQGSRIEPVEIGLLLPFFLEGDSACQFLAALVNHDNNPPRDITQRLASVLADRLQASGPQAVLEYCWAMARRGAGTEGEVTVEMLVAAMSRLLWLCSVPTREDSQEVSLEVGLQEYCQAMARRGTAAEEVATDETHAAAMSRLLWLCAGEQHAPLRDVAEEVPGDFPYGAMARTVLGVAALFSQLALQLSHLTAQLYNVYRRGVFTEVVLSGNVLSGDTGRLVETQTRAFLAKYYDKVYGVGRPLLPDAITRVTGYRISNPGLFGAAMAANRKRQTKASNALARSIQQALLHCEIGEEKSIDDLVRGAGFLGAGEVGRRVVEALVTYGKFVVTQRGAVRRIA